MRIFFIFISVYLPKREIPADPSVANVLLNPSLHVVAVDTTVVTQREIASITVAQLSPAESRPQQKKV